MKGSKIFWLAVVIGVYLRWTIEVLAALPFSADTSVRLRFMLLMWVIVTVLYLLFDALEITGMGKKGFWYYAIKPLKAFNKFLDKTLK